MCGIYCSTKRDDQIIKKINKRGGDKQNLKEINNLFFFSSVLNVNSEIEQPIFHEKFILQFNGEIFNVKNDTEFVKDLFIKIISKKVQENLKTTECQFIHFISKLDELEAEFGLCIFYKETLLFTKDILGRRSLGFTLKEEEGLFLISSVSFEEECDPNFIYCFNLKEKKLKKIPRKREIFFTSFLDLEISLRKSLNLRLHFFKKVIFFSGGIDSLLLTLLLHFELKIEEEIYLLNTSFKENAWDRKKGKKNYQKLKEKFPKRKFIFIDNFIKEVKKEEEDEIRKLIYPKQTIMDFNIAKCLYFSSKRACEISKVVFTGAGADELFGGYNLYKRNLKEAKENMKYDIQNIWIRNMGRDDRIISNFNLEVRFPFLDRRVIAFSQELEIEEIIGKDEDKMPLRDLLRKYGFKEESQIVKRAMQFGSGLFSLEKKNK